MMAYVMPTIAGNIICPNADLLSVAQTDANVNVMDLLPDTQYFRLRMRRECWERFPPPQQVSDPEMHHGTCVPHVPRCMPGSLTSGSFEVGGGKKRFRHSRRMRNRNFTYVVRGICQSKLHEFSFDIFQCIVCEILTILLKSWFVMACKIIFYITVNFHVPMVYLNDAHVWGICHYMCFSPMVN